MSVLRSVLISTIFLNIGILLGRISGFVRESMVGATYGATSDTDILVLMLTVPDLLVNILMGGAMGAALIPEYNSNKKESKKLLFQVMIFFGIAFSLISLILYLNSNILVFLFAPGLQEVVIPTASKALSWVIWLIPLTVLSGCITAYLHSINKFALASLGTLIINLFIIFGLTLAYSNNGSLYIIALSVLIGGSVRLIIQIFYAGFRWSPIKSLQPFILNKLILIRYFQALLSGSVLLFIPVLARAFSSFNGEGSIAVMNFTLRLIEFPMAIAISIFVATLFPRLSENYKNNFDQYLMIVKYGFQSILGISLLIMFGLMLVNNFYVQLIFGYGNMDMHSLIEIKNLLAIGLIVLPFQGLSLFLTAIFNSQKKMLTPLVINLLGLVTFICLYLTSVLGQDPNSIITYMVISYVLTAIMQLIVLHQRKLKILKIALTREYLTGLVLSSFFILILITFIKQFFSSYLLIFLISFISGLISIFVLALSNYQFRMYIKNTYLRKWN